MKGSDMRLQNLVPVLDVRDVEESIEFYSRTLGFEVYDKVEWGGRTEWALLRSGQVQLMLCAGREDDVDDEALRSDTVFFVHLDEEDARQVYLGAYGALNSENMPTGSQRTRDFYLRDPDGYVLWFSHRPLGQPSASVSVQNAPAAYA